MITNINITRIITIHNNVIIIIIIIINMLITCTQLSIVSTVGFYKDINKLYAKRLRSLPLWLNMNQVCVCVYHCCVNYVIMTIHDYYYYYNYYYCLLF